MPMMLYECSNAAVFVAGKFSDELPVSRFTAEAIAEQAVMFNLAAEEAAVVGPEFRSAAEALKVELEEAKLNLERKLEKLEEVRARETNWPCTGCHIAKLAALVIAEEQVLMAKKRLHDAEDAVLAMQHVLVTLPGMEWLGPCEEVMTTLDRFDPPNAETMRAFLVIYRDNLEELGVCTARIGELLSDLPRKFFGGVRRHFGEVTNILVRLGAHADDTETEFRRLHETEIQRLDEPRPGEETWDIGRNGVTSPEIITRGSRAEEEPRAVEPGETSPGE